MKVTPTRPGLALATLRLSVRAQQAGWLMGLYRRLPVRLRRGLTGFLHRWVGESTHFIRTPAWTRVSSHPHQLRRSHVADSLRINVVGYLKGRLGLGESARRYAAALIEHGADVALCDVDLDLAHDWNEADLAQGLSNEVPHPVSLFFINPDFLREALDQLGEQRLKGRLKVACWFWELEQIPVSWQWAIEQMDEFIVASAFVEQALRQVTDKPITRAPLPIAELDVSDLQRADFGLDEQHFIFLSSFDFNSSVARKNPQAVVAAFRQAFPAERTDIRLVIKTSNGFRYPEPLRSLLELIGDDRRIVLRDDILEGRHVRALQRCCDAYVSLHRAEGFGLGMAECMLAAKPVVATRWSGNLEFMNEDNSCLVDYQMIPIPPGDYPESDGQRWANPSIAHAAQWMRRLADDPNLVRVLGASARESVGRSLSSEQAAKILAQRYGDNGTAHQDTQVESRPGSTS